MTLIDNIPGLGTRVAVLEERVDTIEESSAAMVAKLDHILFAIIGLLATTLIGVVVELVLAA